MYCHGASRSQTLLRTSRYTQPYGTCHCFKVCALGQDASSCTQGVWALGASGCTCEDRATRVRATNHNPRPTLHCLLTSTHMVLHIKEWGSRHLTGPSVPLVHRSKHCWPGDTRCQCSHFTPSTTSTPISCRSSSAVQSRYLAAQRRHSHPRAACSLSGCTGLAGTRWPAGAMAMWRLHMCRQWRW